MNVRIAHYSVALFSVGVVTANVWFWFIQPPGQGIERGTVLSMPYVHESGSLYIANVSPEIPSDTDRSQNSHLEVFEEGKRLGPAHTLHQVIRDRGLGGFSHWNGQLYFSSSDSSDPNTNGRRYTVRYLQTISPLIYLGLLIVDSFLSMFFLDKIIRSLWHGRLPAGALRGLTTVGIIVGLTQASCWVLTKDVLAREGESVRQWYAYVFEGQKIDFSPGESINYMEHHYLNYALNPAIAYGDSRQFNSQYRIRRTEPIRDHHQVKWRILVLGGSTTFGELLRREEDTWVSQLEQRVRRQCGDTCDVINGGVGGYTVLENFIHYVTLLSTLAPNVVVLYEGINDVDARLFGSMATDYSNYRLPWRSEGRVLPQVNAALAWLYPYRYYIVVDRLVRIKRMGIGGVVSPPHPPPSEWASALERNGPETYRLHLRNLAHLLQKQGHHIVILPQYFVEGKEGDEIFIKGVQQHNEVNQELAKEMNLPFFSKLANPSLFERDDIFDNCHFNERGSMKMAEEVFYFLMELKLIPLNVNS